MSALLERPVLDFVLPDSLRASEPPEVRGTGRDDVRLLISWRGTGALAHARFADLPAALEAGDLLVVNTSATLPAAVDGRLADGTPVELHFSTRLPAGLHVVELRHVDGGSSQPWLDAPAGMVVSLPAGGQVETLAPYSIATSMGTRLWIATAILPASLETYLAHHGRPIRYGYVPREWSIDAYQTVFAVDPGSAEMPSAARPFTPALVTEMAARGVTVAPLLLHAGVSSGEAHEPPYAEYYRVPPATARQVELARSHGGRVIAAGTTVVRALETVTDEIGHVHAGEGWTEKVVTPATGVRAVDGLLTGWHEPLASHLAMLEAVAGADLLAASYRAALEEGYLWHEFGDSHLILP